MTGKKPATAVAPPPLTFRRDVLIQPPPDQVSLHDDSVGSRVRDINANVAKLAARFGLQMHDFPLQEKERPKTQADVLIQLLSEREKLSVARHGNEWGVYYTRQPSLAEAIGSTVRTSAPTVKITDAPLEVRRQFLHRIEAFVRAYFKMCEDKLGSLKAASDAGDRTLALLANVEPR